MQMMPNDLARRAASEEVHIRVGHFRNLFLSLVPRHFLVSWHSVVTNIAFKNLFEHFRAGRVKKFAATKCDFLAKLVLAARKNNVKFRKNMC